MTWDRIPIAAYVFFGLFVVASITHLVFCFFEKELGRKITKCMTTGFLGIALIFAVPFEPLIYIGLFLGCLGDGLLLKKHKVWPFFVGMLSFLAGHILYIAELMKICSPLHWGYFVATGVYLVLFPILFFPFAKKISHQRKLSVVGSVYFGILSLDLIWSLVACFHGHVDFCLLSVFGSICFLASDAFLTKTLFKKDVRRRDFYIMSTYLLAQAFVTVGLALTVLI